MRAGLVVSLIGGLLPLWRCDGTVCTAVFVYGINATVTDAVTGQPISGATLTLEDGDYSEVMSGIPSALDAGLYLGAGERPGTYTLRAQAEGYEDVVVEDISVDSDECHVIPVEREIQMNPL